MTGKVNSWNSSSSDNDIPELIINAGAHGNGNNGNTTSTPFSALHLTFHPLQCKPILSCQEQPTLLLSYLSHRRRNINLSGGPPLTLFAPYIHDNSFENKCTIPKDFSNLTWLAAHQLNSLLELVYVWILPWQVEWNLGDQKSGGPWPPLAPLVPPPMYLIFKHHNYVHVPLYH